MTSLIHRCFCADGSISFPPSSSTSTSIRSCFPIRLCFHSSDNAVSVSKPKSKKVTRIEETVAFDSQKFASHEAAVSTNACKSVALATEQRGNAYGAPYLDRSHAFDISETDLLRLRRARLSELEHFLVHHADREPSHGNHDGLESSHIGDSKGGSSRVSRGGGESSHANGRGESASHSDHDRAESSRHGDEDESSHSESNVIESAHGNHDAGESFLSSRGEGESSHLDLKEDKLLRRHPYKNELLHRDSYEDELSRDDEDVMLLNNVLGKLKKEGLNNPIGMREKKGSLTSYTRKEDNVAVRSSKRAERLAKRRRANSKSRKEVVPGAFVSDTMSVRKSIKSKKVPFQQPQIDPVRSFLMSNGSTKKELLSQAEEVQLSHKIQDFLALEVIKESLESQIGRRPTLSEWANAAEMDISTFSKRLTEGHQSKNRMIQCNLRLVISVARKYEGKGLSLEDLIQEGSMGLIRGCEKFDPERGFKFCTYAYWWIKQAVMRALFENSRLIRLPAHVVETMLRIGKVRRLLWQKNGVVPSNSDIAKLCGISVEKLKIVTKAVKYCKSIDKPVGKDMNLHLGDILPDVSLESPELRITRDLLRTDLDAVLMTLNPREEVIVRLRFGLDDGKKRTLAEIAKVFHVTRERIRQIESRALRKLRQPQRNERLRGMVEGSEVHIPNS